MSLNNNKMEEQKFIYYSDYVRWMESSKDQVIKPVTRDQFQTVIEFIKFKLD